MISNIYKIPKYIKVLYCHKTQILVLINVFKDFRISFFFTKVFLFSAKILLILKSVSLLLNNSKIIKSLNIKLFSFYLLKYLNIYRIKIKLKLVGIGYKFFLLSRHWGRFLQLKLGYSHSIFFKIPNNIKVILLNPTTIFFSGLCFKTIKSIVSRIKKLRFPEPYKGKGILYDNEKIKLKRRLID